MSLFNKKISHEIKYTRNNLFKHYLKGLLTILLVPFILFYIVLFIFNLRSTEDAFKYSSTEILSRSVTTIDNLLEVMYKNHEALASSSAVQTFFFSDFFSYENNHQAYLASDEILSQLQNICTSLNYINSIHIYSKANSYFLSNVNTGFADNFYDYDCYKIYQNCSTSSCIMPRKTDNTTLLTFCYIINKGGTNEGAIFFNIDTKKLIPSLIDVNGTPGSLILADNSNNILLTSDNNFSKNMPDFSDLNYRQYSITKNKDNVYMVTKLKYDGLTLAYCVTKHTYYTSFYPFHTNTMLFFIFTFSALLLLSVAGTFKLYNSIQHAFAYIETPSSDKNTYSEFVFLTENMMSQAAVVPNTEATLAEKIQKLKKYQALALQTQINPHFLFNSLNLISSYALESEKEDSPLVIIIDKLSEILRFCLNTKNYIIKIEEELKATEKYIEIENIKYDCLIDFIFDIDEEIYNYYTLKMILQPIIENAITHGVKLLRHEKGIVSVSAKIINKKIIFTITNNGPEIPEEKLKSLQKSLLSTNDIPENNHIGLKNVNQRIKLIFGDDYGCYIDSKDKNTIVTIVIPIIKKEHDDFIS